jgi:hypothetical protein
MLSPLNVVMANEDLFTINRSVHVRPSAVPCRAFQPRLDDKTLILSV